MIYPESEVEREGVPVLKDVFDHAPVGGCSHGVEILVVFYFIDVGPCGEVYVRVLSEREFFSIDYDLDVSFQYDDDEMIFWSARLAVDDMVFSLDLTREYVFVDVTDSGYVFGTEQYGRYRGF